MIRSGLFGATLEDTVMFHINHPVQYWIAWLYIVICIVSVTYSLFTDYSSIVCISGFLGLKFYDSWMQYTNSKDLLKEIAVEVWND